MPAVWFSLKRSLHCKSEPSDVHDPKTRKQLSTILTRKGGGGGGGGSRSGCSRSIANLKDVIHGSKRHLEKPPSCSPRSIGSSEFLNPITHEVILSNSRCELKITSFNGFQESSPSSTFVGTLRPGTPGPGGNPTMHYFNSGCRNSVATPTRRSASFLVDKESSANFGGGHSFPCKTTRHSLDNDVNGTSGVTCHKCGEQFGKWEALEAHHLSKHAGKNLAFFAFSSFLIILSLCFFQYFAYAVDYFPFSFSLSEKKYLGRLLSLVRLLILFFLSPPLPPLCS